VASLHSKAIQERCLTSNMKAQRCFETSGGTHPTRCHIPQYFESSATLLQEPQISRLVS